MNRRILTLLATALLSIPVSAKNKSATKDRVSRSSKTSAKSVASAPAPTTGRLTDSRDGKVYRTVVIGKQSWMAQNLNFMATGSACYENRKQNCEELGRLYDWEIAKSACPSGWHLPTEEEWDALETSAGGLDSAGHSLKSTTGWDHEGNGSNSKGFDAIPSGSVDKTGLYNQRGLGSAYWTASSRFAGGAWFRSLNFGDRKLMHDKADKSMGFSVRCVKD